VSRRPPTSSLFRGSELPRLLVLVAVVVAGWPMFVLFARQADQAPPPEPPTVPATLPPVVADPGIEFQALRDRTPMSFRDNAAYSLLLKRARETSDKALAAAARRDLLYTHLWERPERYRGVPVHLEGTALRVLNYEVNPELAPKGRVYEAWVYSDENRAFPYALIFEDPPAGLVLGPDVHIRVTFDGYFLKLLGYRAGDKGRGAPLLVGRLHATPAQPAPPPPMVEVRDLFRGNGFAWLFGLLFTYILIRAVFQVRRALAPRRAAAAHRSLAKDEIAPEELADWLQSLPDEGEEPGTLDRGRDRP